MKNFIIPRTMESGNWSFDADPIQKFEGDAWGKYGMGALLVILVVALVVIVAVSKP